MKNKFYLVCSAILIALSGCDPDGKKADKYCNPKDSVVYSFVFVGCNRLDGKDSTIAAATQDGQDSSLANYYALKRIFREIDGMERKPDLLFFLGDLVCGQQTTQILDKQLRSWVKLYKDTTFSHVSTSGIELVAVPGNHEMLYLNGITIDKHDEWPLEGATAVWMKYMAPYMPGDREQITGSENDQMTFSFTRDSIAFVVMNTDTYNKEKVSDKKNTVYGIEGIIPEKWIERQVEKYHKDPAIKHIFVLGHKPCYITDNGKAVMETGHEGLPEGPRLWPVLRKNNVCAMLSAHNHSYQRMQPMNNGTYQVIAGNGGSNGPTTFFGYSYINILKSGKVQLISKGYTMNPSHYYLNSNDPFTVRDSTILVPGTNANPYTYIPPVKK